MDLVGIGFGFLLGIIRTGFGAVLTQYLEGRRHAQELVSALKSEVRENVAVLRQRIGGGGVGKLQRSAWDAARLVPMKSRERDAVINAYIGAERFNALSDLVRGALASGSNSLVDVFLELLNPQEVLDGFEDAAAALGLDLPPRPAAHATESV